MTGLLAALRARLRIGGGHDDAALEPPPEPMGGTFPGRFDTGHDWRRWPPTARLFATAFFASLGLNLVLVGALVSLLPLLRIEPFLVTVQPESRVAVRVDSLREDKRALNVVVEAWVHQYVDYRHAILPDEAAMKERIVWVAARSEEKVFAEYRENDRALVNQAIADGTTRTVAERVLSNPAPGLYLVDFALKDTLKGTALRRDGREAVRRFRATVRVELRPRVATREDLRREADPASYSFGFTVVRYEVGEI